MTRRYAAIILAAGLSSRMDGFKPLLEIGGTIIADRVISLFQRRDVDVILVTGWNQEKLLADIEHSDIVIAENPDYETGMLSSVQAGIRHLKPEHEAFFLMPVDIPLVRPATVKNLLRFAGENPGHIIYPSFNGKRGHPPLIPALLVPEILNWQEDSGLNAILGHHDDLQLYLPVGDENILRDADNREDFAGLLERFGRYQVPTDEECRALLDIAGTPENIRAHCRKVAEVAGRMVKRLLTRGVQVDAEEVQAAAVLHDIERVKPSHARTGARFLRDAGFERIADIVSVHQDLVEDTDSVDIETKLVYLADKMVSGVTAVPVTQRFREKEEVFAENPEALVKITNRKERATTIRHEIEKLMGCSVESLLQ